MYFKGLFLFYIATESLTHLVKRGRLELKTYPFVNFVYFESLNERFTVSIVQYYNTNCDLVKISAKATLNYCFR